MRVLLPAIFCLSAGSVASASAIASSVSVLPAGTPGMAVWGVAARVLLLALFLFACIAAFKVPGTGIPELFALVLLAALLGPSILAGDARWYELALIAGGLVLICFELFVLPGFGATGVGGLLLLASGLLLAFLPAASPTHTVSLIDLRNALIILVGGSVLGVGAFAWLGRHFPRLAGTNKLVLRETNATRPSFLWPQVGDVGLAVTDLKPGGIVQLPDPSLEPKRVDVLSRRGFIPAGTKVIVTEVVGQVISVKEAGAES